MASVAEQPATDVEEASALENLRLLRWVRQMTASGQAKAIRQAADVSQGEAATFVRVSDATISRWESGQRTPRGEAALRYGQLLRGLLQ
jgi:DNA-binding transcriptional regulator YiaG